MAKKGDKFVLTIGEVIFCKDCVKHNRAIGSYLNYEDEGRWLWKEDCCPLVEFRGKAQGHEFDYQFCSYGKRRKINGNP